MCYHITRLLTAIYITNRKDNLQQHIKKGKHNHTNLPTTSSGNVSPSASSSSSSSSSSASSGNEPSLSSSASSGRANVQVDHNYTMSASTENVNSEHSYSMTNALKRHIQDRTQYPHQEEKYDLLTFFANTKQVVINCLYARLNQQAIKWYLTVQVDLTKNTDDGEQVHQQPHLGA
ncbi:hypothetical protein DPMN_073083 [Dreissena polymorpha]|uniref:Uncharacterized protein n=1 Tax=Dreissena polymorpha TaxID=45954 RepID=A0A9D4HDD9_DREPO|nr:hypothetical protein DPMN_073083 [Dreissena polymorpha]